MSDSTSHGSSAKLPHLKSSQSQDYETIKDLAVKQSEEIDFRVSTKEDLLGCANMLHLALTRFHSFNETSQYPEFSEDACMLINMRISWVKCMAKALRDGQTEKEKPGSNQTRMRTYVERRSRLTKAEFKNDRIILMGIIKRLQTNLSIPVSRGE